MRAAGLFPCWTVLLWSLTCCPSAVAMKCPGLRTETPPLTAAEQAVHSDYQRADEKAEAAQQAAVASDPLLVEFNIRMQQVETALEDDSGISEAFRQQLLRDETSALFAISHGGDEEGKALSEELIQRWQHSAPVWSLHAAFAYEAADQPLAANRALQQYLARSDSGGAFDLSVRQILFRLIGWQLQFPRPEFPATLVDRVAPPCEPGISYVIGMALMSQPETGAALAFEESFCDHDELTSEPRLDTPEDAQALAERPALCARLHHSLRKKSALYAAEDDDLGDEWLDACEAAINQASQAADWRGAMDKLARDGCPAVSKGNPSQP